MALESGIETVDDALVFQVREGYASARFLWAFYLPTASLPDQPHLISASPPVIDLAGQRDPHFGLLTNLGEARQQTGVDVAGALIEQVIGMHNEANQTVLLKNKFDLLLPKIHRVLAEDIEQSVVLRGHDGNFQDFANKVRLSRAAAARLRIEMADIRHRHVVGAIEEFVPIEISIQNAGTITGGVEFSSVVVDASDAAKKFVTITKEVTVMVEIVNVDLEATFAERTQKLIGDFVAYFGNKLKGGLYVEGVVQIHQRGAEVSPFDGFHVVGHCRATGVTVWPKPDEWDGLAGIGIYGAGHHAIEKAINSLVDRPAGETSAIPAVEGHTLQIFANGGGQKGSHSVVGLATDCLRKGSAGNRHGAAVTLETQILHNLVKIKGENTGVVFNAYSGENIVERIGEVRASLAGGDSAITRQIGADAEEAGFRDELSVEAEVHIVRGATEILQELLVHYLAVRLADMAVKQPSGRGEERVGHHGKDALGDTCAPPGIDMERLMGGKAIILKGHAYGTPIFFKRDQAGIVQL